MFMNLVTSLSKRLWFILRLAFWSILWIFGLGVLLLFPLRWFSGDYFTPVRLANFFVPWLLVLLVPAMLIAGLARRKWLLVVLAAPTLLICLIFAPLFWPHNKPSPPFLIASTLLVPGYVGTEEISDIAAFIASLNPEIPYALLAFHPQFMMSDLPPTSKRHAEQALAAAKAQGLRNVRVGNIHLLGHHY